MSDLKNKKIKEDINSSSHYRKIILSNIKHDLTNPVNAILGYSELMLEIVQDKKNEELKRDLQSIYTCGTTILTHINEINFTNVEKQTIKHHMDQDKSLAIIPGGFNELSLTKYANMIKFDEKPTHENLIT